jgi:ubiquitin-like 1-activating enzyme E1 A
MFVVAGKKKLLEVLIIALRSFVENSTAELSPVAAILGGILAQDVINVLAKLEQPIQNLLVFDGDISAAPVIVLTPQADD